MRKLLTISCLLMFAMAGSSFASDTRVETMGFGQVYIQDVPVQSVNSILKDISNVGLYPSTVNNYGNRFYGEIARAEATDDGYGYPDAFYKAGAFFNLNDRDSDMPIVLGAHFTTMPYYHNLYNFNNWFYGNGATHKLNLYTGIGMDGMSFGLNIGYYGSSDKYEDTTAANTWEESFSRFEFGFGATLMEDKVDVAVEVAMTSWKDEFVLTAPDPDQTVEDHKPTGNFDFAVRGRMFMDPMGKFTLVPHGALMMFNQGLEEYYYDGTEWIMDYEETNKTFVLNLGCGMNYDAAEDVLVATDVGFALVNNTYELDYVDADVLDDEWKDNFNVLPYFRMGIDAKVLNWLDFRAGVVSACVGYTDEYEEIGTDGDSWKYTHKWNTTETFLGAGLQWGELVIDLMVDPQFLLQGPYFIGGEATDDTYDGMAAKASFVYNFN